MTSDSQDPDTPPAVGAEPGAPKGSGGIPDAPEGTPRHVGDAADEGLVTPLGDELPRKDFWEAVYERRSIRKFKPDPVRRELVDQVMHAGIWAPSSCNYQMWDLVAVDDPDVNGELAALSLQMSNAPVNIVVSYGRDFSEENFANIQSASALIQNMSLAAQVLGLGTFWITQTGDPEKVRQIVGLPIDRRVVAVLALGYPKVVPNKGPKRRPLSQVTHYNHYAGRPIPSSVDPEDWEPDLLASYQRARVLNGLRHNKPRPWEVNAIQSALEALVPSGRKRSENGATAPRWLDVLPCTGIVTDRIARERPGFSFDIVERSPDVARWVSGRTRPAAGAYLWPEPGQDAEAGGEGFDSPPEGTYDVVSCFYRLEDVREQDRIELFRAMVRWVRPGGRILVGFVNRRSFHDWSERLRARRGGPGGVEYVLSPDPNIGPFRAVDPSVVTALAREAGLTVAGRLGLQAAPPPEEVEFRTRNFSSRSQTVARTLGWLLRLWEKLPGVEARYGRFQFVALDRPSDDG